MSAVAQRREVLATLIKKVPAGINNGSYQAAVNYKKFYAECAKALASSSQNEAQFNSLISRYRSYE